MPRRPFPRLLAVLASLLLAACGTDAQAPALVVQPGSRPAPVAETQADPVERPNFHWFGDVPYGEVVRHTFVLANTSRRTVSVVQATPSCACLALDVRAKDGTGNVIARLHEGGTRTADVPPGGTLEVEFVVDTREERTPNAPRLVQASIRTTDPSVPRIQLEGTVVAVAAFDVQNGRVAMGTVAAEAAATERIAIVQSGARPAVLTGAVLEAPADWIVRVFEDPQPEGRPRVWTLQVTVPPGPHGAFAAPVRLEARASGGEEYEPLVVPVRGERGPTVFAASERLFFRAGSTSTSVRIATRLPVANAGIASVEIDGPLAPALRHNVVPGAAVAGKGPAWTLSLEIVGDAPAECSGRVRVSFVDDLWPPLEIPYARFP
jgi:hypothetical protein